MPILNFVLTVARFYRTHKLVENMRRGELSIRFDKEHSRCFCCLRVLYVHLFGSFITKHNSTNNIQLTQIVCLHYQYNIEKHLSQEVYLKNNTIYCDLMLLFLLLYTTYSVFCGAIYELMCLSYCLYCLYCLFRLPCLFTTGASFSSFRLFVFSSYCLSGFLSVLKDKKYG